MLHLVIYILFINYIFSLKINNLEDWNKKSWRSKKIYQIPEYTDKIELQNVENELLNYAPLVFAGECDTLRESLAKISIGNGFLLMGGDCAETFKDFSINKIRDSQRLILQMSLILTFGSGLPVTKIGRIAGQFAKPRSEEYELIDKQSVLTYRGDIINDIIDRNPDPKRMIRAYHQSTQTLNILRAFANGGYADINRVHTWNLDFVEKTKEGSQYRELADKVSQSLRFIQGLGINIKDDKFTSTNIYTGHECLLLNYEEQLTRIDSRHNNLNKSYDCSAHLLWLGERTRHLDSAHVEFMRGIHNPIGIKLSAKTTPEELYNLIKILNPNNIPGKIVLITRMGHNIKKCLPNLIRIIQKNAFNVVWCCDPMHGNTIKTNSGIKTRHFESIKQEIIDFFDIHRKLDTHPGGIHLELTNDDVTECIGGNINSITEDDLTKYYLSSCDPRLNGIQSLEIAFLISNLLYK
jgi:3-deoxy-7-phosphoheptulonate synthase